MRLTAEARGFILGGVDAAGQFPFVDGMTVDQAVAAAGGFPPPRGPKPG